MCYKYFHNTTIQLLKSFLAISLMGSFTLLGCKKELVETVTKDPKATYFNVQPEHPISIGEAQTWFTVQFGKAKQVAFNPFRVSGTDAYYFHETFTIEPIWESARQSTYRKQAPITIVPVHPIDFLEAKEQKYALIFYRDSLNQLQSQLQVYIALDSYKKVNPQEKVKDFSGIMYQVDYEGRVHHVLAAKEGRFIKEFSLGENRSNGQNTIAPRSCFGLGPSIWEELWCVLRHLFDGGGGNSSDNSDPSDSSNFTNFNLDFGTWWYFNGWGTGGGGGGSANNNNNIDTQIDDTLFDVAGSQEKLNYYQGLYVLEMRFADTEFEQLYNDKKLFTQVEHFFRQHGRNQKTIDFCRSYIDLYFTDSEFREMVSTPIPSFLWDIMFDIGLEIVEKVAKKYFPAAELTEDIKNSIQAIRSGSWVDVLYRLGELALDTAKTAARTANAELAIIDVALETGRLMNKIKKIKKPLEDMYDNLDAATFKKIYTAMSKFTNRNVFDKFDIYPYPFANANTPKHLRFAGSTRDLFHTIRTEFGAGVTNEPPPGMGIYFGIGTIRFTWYPTSGTNDKPTIEIKNGSTTIMKIRQP